VTTGTELLLTRVLALLKAAADEKRLRILTLLVGRERCVCELQRALGVGQSLLSFHLRVLREAGLVKDRREGRWVYYALDREAMGELEDFFQETRSREPDPPPRPLRLRCGTPS
jgi:ArsR family transcriptional regulator, arsenate/arsenite/antimonite-responsive transcriptional repressor